MLATAAVPCLSIMQIKHLSAGIRPLCHVFIDKQIKRCWFQRWHFANGIARSQHSGPCVFQNSFHEFKGFACLFIHCYTFVCFGSLQLHRLRGFEVPGLTRCSTPNPLKLSVMVPPISAWLEP